MIIIKKTLIIKNNTLCATFCCFVDFLPVILKGMYWYFLSLSVKCHLNGRLTFPGSPPQRKLRRDDWQVKALPTLWREKRIFLWLKRHNLTKNWNEVFCWFGWTLTTTTTSTTTTTTTITITTITTTTTTTTPAFPHAFACQVSASP